MPPAGPGWPAEPSFAGAPALGDVGGTDAEPVLDAPELDALGRGASSVVPISLDVDAAAPPIPGSSIAPEANVSGTVTAPLPTSAIAPAVCSPTTSAGTRASRDGLREALSDATAADCAPRISRSLGSGALAASPLFSRANEGSSGTSGKSTAVLARCLGSLNAAAVSPSTPDWT